MYDLIIVGGGPAGVSAGIYASRKKIKILLITDKFGGQSVVAADIQNWIGTKSISGIDLAKNLEEHLRGQEGIEILEGDLVEKIKKNMGTSDVPNIRNLNFRTSEVHKLKSDDKGFKIITKNGKNFETKTVLIASGSRRRRLGVPGEDKLDGKGVSWCSTCDAPLFKGKDAAVIGVGNAGLEAARDLLSYAAKVYLINRTNEVKGDAATFEKIGKNPKVEVIMMAEIQEILGDKFVSGLKYLDKNTGEVKELKLGGVFVQIGSVPNVEFLGDLAEKNQWNEIAVNCVTQETSQPGIWAAGDATSGLYKQNNISAGDAIKAVLNIHEFLQK